MQATTRITRWQARHWRLRARHRRPDRLTRTLTYREALRRGRAGIYAPSPRGLGRAFRDLWRATPPLLVQALMTANFQSPSRFTSDAAIAEDAQKLRG